MLLEKNYVYSPYIRKWILVLCYLRLSIKVTLLSSQFVITAGNLFKSQVTWFDTLNLRLCKATTSLQRPEMFVEGFRDNEISPRISLYMYMYNHYVRWPRPLGGGYVVKRATRLGRCPLWGAIKSTVAENERLDHSTDSGYLAVKWWQIDVGKGACSSAPPQRSKGKAWTSAAAGS